MLYDLHKLMRKLVRGYLHFRQFLAKVYPELKGGITEFEVIALDHFEDYLYELEPYVFFKKKTITQEYFFDNTCEYLDGLAVLTSLNGQENRVFACLEI